MDRTAEYLVNLDEDEEEEDNDDEEGEINRDASVDKDQMKASDVNNQFKWATWRHHSVMEPYCKSKNEHNSNAFFSHITNFVARNHWHRCDTDLL